MHLFSKYLKSHDNIKPHLVQQGDLKGRADNRPAMHAYSPMLDANVNRPIITYTVREKSHELPVLQIHQDYAKV